jgi:D-glycero-D-manno-heptose 1,7-bisphosphate phosphatase
VKLLIVDRDGVVSRDADGRATRAEDWQAVPGSPEAIARLVHGGWHVALLADRGPLLRGACDMTALNTLHGRLIDTIVEHGGRIDAVVFVDPPDAPGRLERAAAAIGETLARLGASPGSSVLVADERADLEAAEAAGCRAMLVLTGHGRRTLASGELPPGAVVRVDLAAVAAELSA